MLLAFLLFQSYKDFLSILQYFDPSLKGAQPDTEVCLWFLLFSKKMMMSLLLYQSSQYKTKIFASMQDKSCIVFLSVHLLVKKKFVCDIV